MYLISISFDEKTNQRIQQYINQVANKTGNTFMTDGNVPPHITVSAMESTEEAQIVKQLERVVHDFKRGEIQFVSVGTFLPSAIFISAVYSEYLHKMAYAIDQSMSEIEKIKIRPVYRPFQWMPHATIGKTLSKEQMKIAFEVLQTSFSVFEGSVVKIGLSKTNPYKEIVEFQLES